MARTSSSDYWTGLRDDLTGLFLDAAHARYVDVEQVDDSEEVRDEAEVRAGEPADPYAIAPAGLPMTAWLLIGVAIIGGAYMLRG